MRVEPYLLFRGDCEAALKFYTEVLGAEVTMLMRFSDAPPGAMPEMPGMADKVMHANLKIGDTMVMASDGECGEATGFNGFAMSISLSDEAEAKRVFAALAEGGEIRMPLAPTFFARQFGTLADRFGVQWMVMDAPEPD
ncbi:MAG TPA: VOC family protein [Denitromonas sp.]|uniref:VOC family protein n=1 Tax=Denitromonas sp. TaxID=2734609 RepID=UPI001DE96F10|nr:VOC family protein [Rhodocyclaceae bacterium]MCP5222070.1 VOC family protein [Zoogloeaceae bacterium]HPR06484.1 VOC family protein [Denitromonas sp.]HQU89187.1 VOC family protein [Denitromonas sp.]HQV15482.1 VOC family protein [Denitromonas sp.]